MDVLETIRSRRSIRSFEAKPIPDTLLSEILEAAQWAPSAGNCQARDFIVVRNEETKRKLSEAALGQEFIEEVGVDIVVCANMERSARRYGERGRRLYSTLDAAASVQNLLLAAQALGLGTCWVGAFSDETVTEILGLPSYLRPVGIIPVGFPGETPMPPRRMPLERVVHWERF